VLHGALLDAQLLAQVYVELMGGRQIGLSLVSDLVAEEVVVVDAAPRVARPARHFAPSEGELAAHAAFMTRVKNPIWGAVASG
jgi:DNA polymerase-3 subunit epsilon